MIEVITYFTADSIPIMPLVFISIFVICSIMIIAMSILDLHFGKKKAKDEGIFKTHSEGLRRTISKVKEYLALSIAAFFIDILISFLTTFFGIKDYVPLFTILVTCFAIYTEYLSIKEKSSEKFRYAVKNNPKAMMDFIKENREVINELIKGAKDEK